MALATSHANHIPQQHLAVFNGAAPEIVAIEVQEVESEIGEPVRSHLADGIAQRVEMRDAAIVGNGDLTIQHHSRQLGMDQRPEGLAEEPCAVIPIPAEQHELAVARKDSD